MFGPLRGPCVIFIKCYLNDIRFGILNTPKHERRTKNEESGTRNHERLIKQTADCYQQRKDFINLMRRRNEGKEKSVQHYYIRCLAIIHGYILFPYKSLFSNRFHFISLNPF